MLDEHEEFFVFGRRGRFGFLFTEVLRRQNRKVYGYNSEEVSEGTTFLASRLRANSRCCVFWCLGPGNSSESNKDNREYDLLNIFYDEIKYSAKSLNQLMVVYVSTGGKMYGVNSGQVSEDSVVSPVGIYGRRKLECELLIEDLSLRRGIRSVIFRIANAYNLKCFNLNPKGFVEACLSSIEKNKRLNFTVNPNSMRQYGSHSDYVAAILELLDRKEDLSIFTLYNLAPSFSYTLYQIVDTFEKHFNKKIDLEYYELDKLDEDSIILESNRPETISLNLKWKSIEHNLLSMQTYLS